MDEEKIIADDMTDIAERLTKLEALKNIIYEDLERTYKQIECLKREVECHEKIDKLIKEYFESHIGDTITQEMIDNLWGE